MGLFFRRDKVDTFDINVLYVQFFLNFRGGGKKSLSHLVPMIVKNRSPRFILFIIMASTICLFLGEMTITSSDGDYIREVTSRW